METDEISLLDLLQTLVDHLRLLVIGPVIGGALAFMAASWWPKTFESTAILRSEQNIATQMLTASVLDPIAVKRGYTPQLSIDAAQDQLKERIKINYNAKEKLVTVQVQGVNPQDAQSLANDLLGVTFAQSQPRGSARQSLQKQLEQLQTREKELATTTQLLAQRLGSSTNTGVSDVAQGYAQLVTVIEKTQANQIAVEKELQGLDSSNIVQTPTLPTRHASPRRGLLAAIAALATGFALLLYVFMRQALVRSGQDSESAEKIHALRAAWRKALGV